MPKIKLNILILLSLSLIFSACNLPGSSAATPTLDPIVVLTGAALTVESKQATAFANTTPQGPAPTTAFFTPIPTFTTAPQQPTITKPPATSFSLCDAVFFIKDVTYPDGTEVAPGEIFTKTWELRNDGTCTWTDQYGLAFDNSSTSSAQMGGPDFQAFPSSTSVNRGDTMEISVELTAPTTPGTYRGNWLLRNTSGVKFGLSGTTPFWVEIVVVGPTKTPTATSPGPTNTPVPAVPTDTNTPAPVVDFSIGYAGAWLCDTQDRVSFKLTNTGDETLQSMEIRVEGPIPTYLNGFTNNAPFRPIPPEAYPACVQAGIDQLASGDFAYASPNIPSKPAVGESGRVTITLCTADDQGGVCTTHTFDFTW